jgi:hypothetical protein
MQLSPSPAALQVALQGCSSYMQVYLKGDPGEARAPSSSCSGTGWWGQASDQVRLRVLSVGGIVVVALASSLALFLLPSETPQPSCLLVCLPVCS